MPAGRPAVPDAIKRAKKTFRAHRAHETVQFSDQLPEPPTDLSESAQRAWTELAPMLHQAGVLKSADRIALTRLCECWAEIKDYRAAIAKYGILLITPDANGNEYPRANPAVRALAEADRRLLMYLSNFGLTPSSRSKVKVEEPTADDPVDAYFN